ncbi:ABC transporter permease [bacterium]|nr:ABC transporter permease [bacterium]
MIKYIGSLVLYSIKHTNGITNLLKETIISTLTKKKDKKEIIYQMYQIGPLSFVFITLIMALLAFILVSQFGAQAVKFTGTADELGGPYFQLIIRQFGPFIVGMMLASKVTTSIAAEVASMRESGEIDSLRMIGISPIDYVVVSKFLASIPMTFILVIYGVIVAEYMGAFAAKTLFDTSPDTFISILFIEKRDIIQGVLKTFLIGVFIPITGCYAGLLDYQGKNSVGEASNKGIVFALSAVGLIDLVGGGVSFLFF